ncbi:MULTISPECIES: signal peptide peptidase SppA [Nostocales]|uniref:signal peptide peptidase SppA n=1 Tax=Nostocales TaxID=1161 RepID=UPI001688288B|nr:MULTISPECIES: signal peptide peptidase SppA [Nostocales]MBD2301658.1 signal peptide peptidase SppA [Nostoc sp. FACHB-190]MBD2490754.1 signal peptide peptidase SppA [Aulosira sp. FACHB-615]
MTNFVKQTAASVIGSLLGLFIFFGIGTTGLFLLLFAIAATQEVSPVVKNKSVLVFDLSLNITDREPTAGEELQRTLSGTPEDRITLRKVLDAINQAKQDPKIVGIYIDGSNSSGGNLGFASLKEIRKALEEFRAAGKKVVAYGQDWGKKEYYLSSVADTVVLNPLGAIEINGLGSQPMFLSGALQKFGIGVQVVRVGKFKGAVEPFILNKLSPENREQTQKLLDDVWSEWRTTVGTSRKINPQKLQAIADNQAIVEAPAAKTNGLVDQVAYHDQVVADLKKLTDSDQNEKNFRQVDILEYSQVINKSLKAEQASKNQIAVVYAEGEIVDGSGDNEQVGGDRFAKIFNKIRQDKNIKAVVLRINSPGGSATAAEIMQREIRLTHEVKPVVVSMGDVAASGGYWIASDSSRIFAEPNTITGSIGVFGILFNGQKLANDNGITWDVVKTARYADAQTVARPKSPQEIALYQRSVNRIYSIFLDKVAKGRKLPEQKVAEIAQGRIWSGVAAKQIGLVDEIGGLNAAVKYAAEKANLGNNWQLKEYPKENSLNEILFGKAVEEASTALKIQGQQQIKATNPLTAEFQKLQQELEIFQSMNDPNGVYARLPFNLKIE